MSEWNIAVSGDRVRQARILRRISGADIAKAMNWSPATQTRLERTDSKALPVEASEKLATVLRVSLNFLRALPSPPLSEDDLRFRAARTTTKEEKSYLIEFARVVSDLIEWLDNAHRLPPVKIPQLPCNSKPVDAAESIRKSLNCGADQPIGHLTHRAERAGVVVVVRKLMGSDVERWDKGGMSIEKPAKAEKHFGYSSWVGSFRDRPLIVLRAIDSWERTRWTIAHELAHLALHHAELPRDAEDVASEVASELLAPINEVRKELSTHVTLAELVPIKAKWGISLGSLIMHLRKTGTISSERADALGKQLYTRINPRTGRTWGLDEPGADDRVAERPRLLSRWAERCLGTASPAALSEVMSTSIPSDVLLAILATQRNPGRGSSKGSEVVARPGAPNQSNVVSLSDRRREIWSRNARS